MNSSTLCAPVSVGLTALTLLGLASVSKPAAASNLIKDGGFESATPGYYSAGSSFDGGDWTVTQGTVLTETFSVYSHSGNQSVYLTPVPNTDDGIEQTVGTRAGQSYTLSFFAATDNTDNTFDVLFDGTTVAGSPLNIPGPGTAGYTGYTFDVTAPTDTSTLEFDASSSQGATFLDDVSLTSNASPAPEPSQVGMLGLVGLSLAGLLLRARRKNPTLPPPEEPHPASPSERGGARR